MLNCLENWDAKIGNVLPKQFHDMKKSAGHRNAMVQLLLHSNTGNHVDAALVRQEQAEHDYWRSVLERVAETNRHLSVQGLAFHGTNEILVLSTMVTSLAHWSY
jgi:hypothetical protein